MSASSINLIAADKVGQQTIDEASEGQRIDNFLAKILKGVPKSHLYRILRSGEVRVNKKRASAEYRLMLGDVVRIPPIRVAKPKITHTNPLQKTIQSKLNLDSMVIYEDDAMLALNKPSGLAVHGGSGISLGVIEQLRYERPQAKFLELVHRLDRETSGVLLIAKKRSALTALHCTIRHRRSDKRYLMLVQGHWLDKKKKVSLSLQKYLTTEGERRVQVSPEHPAKHQHNNSAQLELETQCSETWFYLKSHLANFTYLEAKLVTGRTHQLRVQTAHLGFPILGDDKYGDFTLNKALHKQGLKRMFLHASEIRLLHPITKQPLHIVAPLPQDLSTFLQHQILN